MSDKKTRSWIFTLNNPTDEEIAQLLVSSAVEGTVEILAVCHEIGDSGTPHLQGMIEFKHAKTLTAFKKWAGSSRYHLQKRKGSVRRAWAYAMKGEQSKTEWEAEGEHGDNWGLNRRVCAEIGCPAEEEAQEGGTWPRIVEMVKKGSSYLEIVDAFPSVAVSQGSAIKQYMTEYHNSRMGWRDLTTMAIYGPTGVGKTRSIMEAYGYANCYRVTDYKNAWDAYNGEDVVILEEFRNSLKIEQMLNYLDGYPVRLPCRYADKMAQFTKVFIVSNWKWNQQYDGIQMNYPETYAALMRRIPVVLELQTQEEADNFKIALLAEQNYEKEQ